MLFGDIDWNQVLIKGLIGGAIGGAIGLVMWMAKPAEKKKKPRSDDPDDSE
jgi:hypothetical protein